MRSEDRLYVADTNNNKIRVVDLKTHAVKTLALEGLTAPRLAPRPPSFPNKPRSSTSRQRRLLPVRRSRWTSSIPLAKGYKLNEEVPLTYLVETPEKERSAQFRSAARRPENQASGPEIHDHRAAGQARASAGEKIDLRVSLQTFVCSEVSSLCQIKSYVWKVPIEFSDAVGAAPVALSTDTK